jgi:hypothetical protein
LDDIGPGDAALSTGIRKTLGEGGSEELGIHRHRLATGDSYVETSVPISSRSGALRRGLPRLDAGRGGTPTLGELGGEGTKASAWCACAAGTSNEIASREPPPKTLKLT